MRNTDGQPPDQAGVRFPPPFVFLGFALLGPVIGRWAGDWHFGGGAPAWALGAALLIGGLGAIAAANGSFRRAGTRPEPWKPSALVVDAGIYQITRNPMYLGMAAAQLGIAVLLDSGWSALLTLASLWVVRTQVIAREEAYLAAKFVDAYRDYCARVPRWL